jgi:hypothetical protein
MGKTLVIAFDGLDKAEIEELGLEKIMQEEFGTIDNSTGIDSVGTVELFASFITGRTIEEHGVQGVSNWNKDYLRKIENFRFSPFKILTLKRFVRSLPWVAKTSPTKEDLKCDTIFEEIPRSKAMFVPSYEPEIGFKSGKNPNLAVMNPKLDSVEDRKKFIDKSFRYRKSKLMEELGSGAEDRYDFLMCHFHKPDWVQHFHGDRDIPEEVKEELYREMDELAGEILDASGFDTVIFMSDHGFVEDGEKEHNENAFYSCNKDLFGDETPHITDFRDRIVQELERWW